MNHKIPCEIIRDLMPLYVDGITSEATDSRIGEHLEECGECKKLYDRMKTDMENSAFSGQTDTGDIDYLKKLKVKNLRNVLLGAGAVFVFLFLAAFVKLFFLGRPTDSYVVTYANVNGTQLNVGGVFYGSADVFGGYKLVPQENGAEELVIYACLPSVWNRSGSFNLELPMPPQGTQIEFNGITIKSDGTVIGKLANQLFMARHPYVGDMSANGSLADKLGIARTCGSFKNELQTTREPYGWTLNFQDSVSNSAVFDEKMKAYSCVLIALTDNLEQVSWNYTVELEQGSVQRSGKMTEQDCSEYLGEAVKTFAESPDSIQRLCGKLGLEQLFDAP